MQYVAKDRIQMGSSSTGTGNLILSFQTNRRNFLNLPAIGANTPNNKVYYSISDGTNWEVGIGSFAGYANTISTLAIAPILTREEVFESSNGNSFVDFSVGVKNVSLTLPANVTQGSVATADNSSIGTDLVAWNNLKKELNRRIIRSVPYDNRGVGGVVSTYSLVRFGSGVYRGGVVDINGDVHFINSGGNVGQKVSSAGVVSTYSLVYTNGAFYTGGVLAPNGDIHFIPGQAIRGQKISVSGVVSTYSLIYTNNSSDAYGGGVLAPNGDIQFIPSSAPVGQKISATGVVSTYSLVYTTSSAYQGGVLAPNGDIHFVPFLANRGQKISAAGVVSTYSLVYTFAFGAYRGGVLAPNGDIHFVPNFANRGQKISSAGVVSTYSLVYTTAGAAGGWVGGVLAPNGDIHFVPHIATAGQKISTGINLPLAHCASPFFNKF